jgi:hypothetical protein
VLVLSAVQGWFFIQSPTHFILFTEQLDVQHTHGIYADHFQVVRNYIVPVSVPTSGKKKLFMGGGAKLNKALLTLSKNTTRKLHLFLDMYRRYYW